MSADLVQTARFAIERTLLAVGRLTISLLVLLLAFLAIGHPPSAASAGNEAASARYGYDSTVAEASRSEPSGLLRASISTSEARQGRPSARIIGSAASTTASPIFVAPRSALDDGVTLINGRRPINSSYAGRVYDGASWTDDLAARYPGGVRFNDAGFPDFSPYARARTQSDNLTGVYRTDAAAANQAVGLPRTPSNHAWHHVEDGRTMILIPQDIHDAVRHTGGAAVIRGGG